MIFPTRLLLGFSTPLCIFGGVKNGASMRISRNFANF